MITFNQDDSEPYREITCVVCGEVIMKGHFHVEVLKDIHLECPKCKQKQEKNNGETRNYRSAQDDGETC